MCLSVKKGGKTWLAVSTWKLQEHITILRAAIESFQTLSPLTLGC